MRQLSFATNRGCCTSISTWHCCPSAVTQSTVSPLKLRKLCQCVRVLFSNLFWSSHFIFLALSFLGSFLTFWQTLTETFSLSSVVHLHFRLSLVFTSQCPPGSELHVQNENKEMTFLSSFSVPFWNYLWWKFLYALCLHSLGLIILWSNIQGGGEASQSKIAF